MLKNVEFKQPSFLGKSMRLPTAALDRALDAALGVDRPEILGPAKPWLLESLAEVVSRQAKRPVLFDEMNYRERSADLAYDAWKEARHHE